jgi:hypothetical protein
MNNSLLIIKKDEIMASFVVFILNLEANEENESPWLGYSVSWTLFEPDTSNVPPLAAAAQCVSLC